MEGEVRLINSTVIYKMLKQLWFQSDNCLLPIKNMGIDMLEVQKFTSQPRDIIIGHFRFLANNKIIECISEMPLLYQFTEEGKLIKTVDDINKLIEKNTGQ